MTGQEIVTIFFSSLKWTQGQQARPVLKGVVYADVREGERV